jgi:predicted amidophosphoribosyltransferase
MKRRRLSIRHITAEAAKRLTAALLPQDCLLCGAPAGARLLCGACEDALPRLPHALCPVCALPSPAGEPCGACLTQAPHYDATLAGFRYDFPVDRLVQALKYDHRLAVAPWFRSE